MEDHLAACLGYCQPLPAVGTALLDSVGLALASAVTSSVTLPPFPNSSMDGYAVRCADVEGAAEESPVKLPVSQDIPAGAGMPEPLEPGTAARIMTGAPVPEGTEAIVQVEWTDAGTDSVEIERAPSPGMHIRQAGEDVREGQVLLEAGHVLGPRAIGLLAATGHDEVMVHRRPRVAVMSTGAELVPPGQPLGPGQIHDSNSFSVASAVMAMGAEARRLPAVDDEPEALAVALREAAAEADLVITTGGISAGAYDVVKGLLAGGAQGCVEFVKVAMRPGMPQGVGSLVGDDDRQVPIITLPGNPVSAWVSFELFVRPMVRRLAGRHDLVRPTVVARADTLGSPWRSANGKQEMARVVLEPQAASATGWAVRRVGAQNSHLVADLAHANALAVVPPTISEVHDGDLLTCIPLAQEEGPV